MRSINVLSGGMPHCKRCNVELSGTETVCPRCNFAPRQEGFRLAGYGLLLVVLAMIGAQLSMVVYPAIGPYLLVLAGLSFGFTFAMFVLGMFATPYRFGRLFSQF